MKDFLHLFFCKGAIFILFKIIFTMAGKFPGYVLHLLFESPTQNFKILLSVHLAAST